MLGQEARRAVVLVLEGGHKWVDSADGSGWFRPGGTE
jgi:hypothetical protein